MERQQQIITVIGGSGFVGRHVVKHLAKAGYRIRIVSRNPEAAMPLKTAADPGQIDLLAGNITKPETMAPALQGAFAIINLVGILFEQGNQNFNDTQAKAPENIAKMAKNSGVKRFIHLSALGVDKAFGSAYARTKLMGEKAVIAAFAETTILRPSVIFGADDHFFNQFAALPFLPVIGGGKTKFQPVYVDDVAKAVVASLKNPQSTGQVYELGGATTYSFRALLDFVQATLGSHKPMIPLSFGMASLFAGFNELAFRCIPLIRRPALTRDQVKLLKYDNVISPGTRGFADLGITPQPLEVIVPRYLARFNPKKVV